MWPVKDCSAVGGSGSFVALFLSNELSFKHHEGKIIKTTDVGG